MLIPITDTQAVIPLIQRKALNPEHLYLSSGFRMPSDFRLNGETLVALKPEQGKAAQIYLRAIDLCDELNCTYKVLSKAMTEEDPEHFVAVIDEVAKRLASLPEDLFDLAYAHLSWHTADDYPVMHHLLVAVTLCQVGRKSGMFEEEELLSHMKAALTMNISMLTLQARLREQVDPLTKEQKDSIRRHPDQSVSKLKLLGVTDPVWIDTVQKHHELPDGSGYPHGIKSDHAGAILLNVCDSFNARMAQREYKDNFTAEQAVVDLFGIGDTRYSEFTAILLEELGIYPAGSIVQLAGGQIGCSLIRGETATTPLVLAFKNMPLNGPAGLLIDSANDGCYVRHALPKTGMDKLPSLLELLSRVV